MSMHGKHDMNVLECVKAHDGINNVYTWFVLWNIVNIWIV